MDKQFLKEHVDKLAEADQFKEELDNLYIMLKSPSLSGTSKSTSSGADKIGEVVARIEEKEARYLAKLKAILDEEKEIEKEIEKLKDARERIVMRYRYIIGLKWEEICVKSNYSWRQVHRLHAGALKKMA